MQSWKQPRLGEMGAKMFERTGAWCANPCEGRTCAYDIGFGGEVDDGTHPV